MISSVACGRFELAIFAAKYARERIFVLKAGLIIGLITTVFLQVLVVVFQNQLNQQTDSHLITVLTLTPIAGLFLSYFTLFTNFCSREGAFSEVAYAKVFRSSLTVSAQFLSIYLPHLGLVIGEAVGRFLSLFPLMIAKSSLLLKKRFSYNNLRYVLKRHSKFLKVSTPSAIVNVLVLQSPVLMLGSLYGLDVAGFYFLAQRLVAAPMALIGTSVGQVMSSEISRYWLTDKERCLYFYLKGTKKLMLLSLPPIALLAIISPFLFPFFLGYEWKITGYFVSALSLMFLGQFVVTPFINIISIAQRQELGFYWDFGRLILVLFSIFVPFYSEQSALAAVSCYSITMAISYLILHNMLLNIVGTK